MFELPEAIIKRLVLFPNRLVNSDAAPQSPSSDIIPSGKRAEYAELDLGAKQEGREHAGTFKVEEPHQKNVHRLPAFLSRPQTELGITRHTVHLLPSAFQYIKLTSTVLEAQLQSLQTSH